MKNRFRRLLSAVMAIIMTAFLLPVQAGEDSSMRQHTSGTETENGTMLGFDSSREQQIYSFNPAAPDEAQLMGGIGETGYGPANTNAVEYVDGMLYFYDGDSGYYFSAPVDSPQEMTQLGYMDEDDYRMYDMDFDHSTNTMYALGHNGDTFLLLIDKETGSCIEEYPLNDSGIVQMGITTEGGIYAFSSNGTLYSIVISDGAAVKTVVGTSSVCPSYALSSMAYDHNGGAMYLTVNTSTELYRIDLETAEAESVGDLGFMLNDMVSVYDNVESFSGTMLGFDTSQSQKIYSFDPAAPGEAQLVGSFSQNSIFFSNAVEYIDGTLYFFTYGGYYYSAPADSPWETTQLGYIDIDEYWFFDLDFDYSTNTLYALGTDIWCDWYLLTIDKETGNYVDTYLLYTPSGTDFERVGITTDGCIYAALSDGRLYSIAISDSEITQTIIGTIPSYGCSSMAFDHNAGVMYATVQSSTGSSESELYSVNLDTAETKYIGNFAFSIRDMVCIYDHNAVPSVPAESVELDLTLLSLGLGQTDTLTACVYPINATDRSVVWTSDNEEVATVDADGVVTGVSLGTATITATTVSGGHTASCLVQVTPLGALGDALNVGGCTNMYTTGHDHPWGVGTCLGDVCAFTTLIDHPYSSWLETTVTLNAGDVISFWHYAELGQGEEATLKLTINNRVIKLHSNEGFAPPEVPNYHGAWAYYSTTVDESGEYTIQWVFSSNLPIVGEKTCFAYIKDVYIGAYAPVEGVTMTESAELLEDSYFRLEWEVYPAYAANKAVTFVSTDESVVTVSPKGLIHAVSPGTAEVILTTVDGGYTASCTVTVTPSDCTRLYGIDIINDCLLTFTDSDPGHTEVLFDGFVHTVSAVYYDGLIYGIATKDEIATMFDRPHIWTYDLETEQYYYFTTSLGPNEYFYPRHIAYDYANSKMYVLGFWSTNGRFSFFELDLTSGTIIEGTEKEIGAGILPTCFAVSLNGTAYIIDTNGILYSFDPAADVIELTAIGNTGLPSTNGQPYCEGLCFNYQTGTLYYSYVCTSDYGLCIVDVNTAEVERLGQYVDAYQVCGLFTIYDVPEHVLGDANGDGNVDMADALQIMRHSMGISTIPDEYLGYVDMNNDGVVNSADALIVARMCMAAMQ